MDAGYEKDKLGMSGKDEVIDTDSHRLRWKRLAILTTLGPVVLLAIVLSAAKWVVEAQAQSKARGIVGSIEQSHGDVDAISMRLTALVHQALQKSSSSTHIPLLMRLRPYLSHRLLPPPSGLIPARLTPPEPCCTS